MRGKENEEVEKEYIYFFTVKGSSSAKAYEENARQALLLYLLFGTHLGAVWEFTGLRSSRQSC